MKLKYQILEKKPTATQIAAGFVHSVYAEEVINSTLDNNDLADKIAARSGFKAGEVAGMLDIAMEVIREEMLESNAITLSDRRGKFNLKVRPNVSGSISDKDVTELTQGAKTVAEATDLTAEMLQVGVKVSVGRNFTDWLKENKQLQRVAVTTTEVAEPDEETPDSGTGNQPEEL